MTVAANFLLSGALQSSSNSSGSNVTASVSVALYRRDHEKRLHLTWDATEIFENLG
jgi:hypothetical protein